MRNGNPDPKSTCQDGPKKIHRQRTSFKLAAVFVAAAAVFGQPAAALADVVVGDSASLVAALSESQPGARIVVLAGSYELDEALYVPDGVTLAGEGAMQFDSANLPIGMAAAGRTVLKAATWLTGGVVTLGDGAGLQGLVIEDTEGRAGNVVVISSRSEGDSVAAWISQCEIVNASPVGVSPGGPTGRGVLLVTRNPNLGAAPSPHENAAVSLTMNQSLVRAPLAGSGVMAVNFAAHSRITVFLTGNVIGGGLDMAGGVSRPDEVTDSSVTLESSRNLFRSDSPLPSPFGWNIVAATDAPVPGLAVDATHANRLSIGSTHDRIEGFANGIYAQGGRRNSPLANAVSMNELDIRASDLVLQTTAGDLLLFGDYSYVPGMPAGDGNVVRVVLRGAAGSGLRANRYEHSLTHLGGGNKLVLPGNADAFREANRNILPAPPANVFTSGH